MGVEGRRTLAPTVLQWGCFSGRSARRGTQALAERRNEPRAGQRGDQTIKIQDIQSHEQAPLTADGATGAKIRVLIGPDENAPNFYMRHVEVEPGGCTPHHAHDYEHEIIVLKGGGTAKAPDSDRPFKTGDVIYVPPGETHQLVNTSAAPCELICLIPAPKECSR